MGYLNSFVEIQNLGWNLLTLSFIGTIVLTLLQMKAMREQGKIVWGKQNGDSVSVVQFAYFAAYLFAILPYGIAVKSLALIFNSFLGIFSFYILAGLWRYKKGVSRFEWVLAGLCFLIIPLMIIFDVKTKELLFSALLFGILIFSACQLYELVQKKDAGNVVISVQKMFLVSNTFWFFYSLIIGNVPLIIFSPTAFVINGLIIHFAKKYSGAA